MVTASWLYAILASERFHRNAGVTASGSGQAVWADGLRAQSLSQTV